MLYGDFQRLIAKHDRGFCPPSERMDKPEPMWQSFVVKLRLEVDDETGRVVWHGYITHVPDGERRYLKTLSDITDFIAATLKKIGVDPEPSRLTRWLRRMKLR